MPGITLLKAGLTSVRRRLSRAEDEILVAGALDADHYRAQAGLPAELDDARRLARHYLAKGWRADLDPAPWFSGRLYRAANPDIADGAEPPFVHFLRRGRDEGRDPRPVLQAAAGEARAAFDADFYLARNPDVAASRTPPFEHFLHHGWTEGRDPAPWFSLVGYLALNPDVAVLGENPFVHYLRQGAAEGRIIFPDQVEALGPPAYEARRERVEASGLFDAEHYRLAYPDVGDVDPLDHFLRIGSALGRDPSAEFDTGWYADRHQVTTLALGEPLVHFLAADRQGPTRPATRLVFTSGPTDAPPATRVAVHLHVPVAGRIGRLRPALARIGESLPLLVTTTTAADARYLETRLERELGREVLVRPGAVEGEAPLPLAFSDLPYDAVLCLHAEGDEAWRAYQFDSLLGSPSLIDQAARRLAGDPTLDVLTPAPWSLAGETPPTIPSMGWMSGAALARRVLGPTSVETFRVDRRALGTIAPDPDLVATPDVAGAWPRETSAALLQTPRPVRPRAALHDPARLDIHWIMPDLLEGSGGHMTIFRLIEQLAARGHRQTIRIFNPRDGDPERVRREAARWFRPLAADIDVQPLPDDLRGLSGDVLIATECWTAFPAAMAEGFKARFYLVQDYEPMFHPAGAAALAAAASYELGLDALCAGDWLLGKARAHGAWARAWPLAADQDRYFPAPAPVERSAKPLIAVYARSGTARRAVDLAFTALSRLAERGVVFEAALFGDPQPPPDLPFDARWLGVMTPADLGDLYRRADVGLVFSATNYSLAPLEMTACGLPVVELDGESTRAVFRDGQVRLAPPRPDAIADALESLLADPAARADQAARGRAYAETLGWPASARALEDAIVERLAEGGWGAVKPPSVALGARRRASVVIPTYNAGADFQAVLDRVARQACDFDYDVLVIDSESSDGTAERAARAGGRVRLERIAKADFQHGATRNLGVSLTDGAIIAFLTQDALPADDRWLARLASAFDGAPRVAGAFGRHRAYPEHGPLVARDMDDFFDRLRALGPRFGRDLGLPGFISPGSAEWRMTLAFYSDNNSAMSRTAWEQLPYPAVDWGEDQTWAAEATRLGWEKAYVDDAVVFHSHPHEPERTRAAAFQEGLLFKARFGIDLVDPALDVEAFLAATAQADRAWALAAGVDAAWVERHALARRDALEGRRAGALAAG